MTPLDHHEYRNFACRGCGHIITVPVYCGNRFCNVCNAHRRRRIRAKLEAIVRQVKPIPSYSFKFLTLTIPNTDDLRSSAQQLIKSFRRLRQRHFFRSRCWGGAHVIEVTGTPGNWHVHLHAIIYARFLNVRRLSREWQKVSPGKIVYIQRIPPSGVIRYVTKYITKTAVPEQFQLEASSALKGFRLFQPFGKFHDIAITVPKIKYTCPKCGYDHWVLMDDWYLDMLRSRAIADT